MRPSRIGQKFPLPCAQPASGVRRFAVLLRLDLTRNDLHYPRCFLEIRRRHRECDDEEIVFRAIDLDGQALRSEFDTAQKKMPGVIFIMCLDMTQVVIGIFELSLDRKRPANRPSPLTIFVMMDVGASAGRLPVPGQEFADAIDRMIGDAGENVPQISLRIEPIHLGGLKEGIHRGGSHAAGV
jgi:hypothetical protein